MPGNTRYALQHNRWLSRRGASSGFRVRSTATTVRDRPTKVRPTPTSDLESSRTGLLPARRPSDTTHGKHLPVQFVQGRPEHNRLLKAGGASHFVARAPRDRPDGAPRRAKLTGPIYPQVLSTRRETPGELRANTDRIPSEHRANSWKLQENPVCTPSENRGNSEETQRLLRVHSDRKPSELRAYSGKLRANLTVPRGWMLSESRFRAECTSMNFDTNFGSRANCAAVPSTVTGSAAQ